MEVNLTVSREAADEGNPTFTIQADNDKPGQAERNPTISASFQADQRNSCVSVQAEGSTLSAAEATQPSILGLADLNTTPLDPAQEPTESIEEVQDKTSVVTVHVSTSGDVEEIHKDTVVETVHSSTLLYTNSIDVPMANNLQEGDPACKPMGSPAAETPEEEVVRMDADSAFGILETNRKACININEDFLPIGDIDGVPVSKETDFVGSKSISMQDDGPCNKEFFDNNGDIRESPNGERRLSLKRSRSSCFDSTPCVQVIYKSLTSESKKKLKELLQQWAQWHGQFVGIKEDAERGTLESGDETYFPPLQVGGVSNLTVSFWMDKPSKQARTENTTGDSTPASQAKEKEVPLYDRAGIGALISQETEISLEGGLDSMEEGSRCFNCGSYSHSLKECPRPRDASAINNARKSLAEKRGSANGSRSASRYYQTTPGGKFDDLKPGVLGSETRQLLGIGERDPPPWLNRMRELGYPPGYLEDQEEEHSGITIFGTNEDADGTFIGEDGEIMGESKKRRSSAKTMKVHFPGLNAPIPDDADRHVWGSTADMGAQDRPSHRGGGRNVHSNYSSKAEGSAHTGMDDLDGPPGCGRDNYGRNSKMRSPGFEGPLLNKTPPWQPSEHGRLGMTPLPRSPHLNKSSSDSGRRSPKVVYDDPYSLPPLGHYPNTRPSPSQILRPHHSPSTPNQRFPQRQDSRDEDSRRRAWALAQDALHSVHHNDRYSPARRR